MADLSQNVLFPRLAEIKNSLSAEFAGIRSNRANPAMVEGVEVEVYGSRMKLRDLAHISAPDARLLVVQPWDASQVETIAKCISAAGLGVNPAVEGGIIRLPLPPLTEERRQEITKLVRSKLEEARVAVRQARQDHLQSLKRAEEAGEIGEDEVKRGETQAQREVDEASSELEEMAKAKEAEVMTV